MRSMRTIVVVSLLGCHAPPPPAMPVAESWLQIADPGYARAHSNVTRHTALPFAFERRGVDGTQLLLQFLGTAEERGAAYASNVAIVLQMTHDGTPIECVSKIVLAGSDPDDSDAPASEPDRSDTAGSTMIHPWRPDVVTAQVDDHKFACERKATRPEATESAMEADTSASVKRLIYINTPTDPIPITVDWHDECHQVTSHREVQRYEHFVAAHFQPPDLDKLDKVFSPRKLVELPPECHVIAAVTKPFQRIEADLGYSGQRPQIRVKPMPAVYKIDWGIQRKRLMQHE